MKRPGRSFLFLITFGLIVCTSRTVAQDTSLRTLVVNGKTVDIAIVQEGSRSYVDIEGLAQVLGGSVVFAPNQITLTIVEPTAAPVPETGSAQSSEISDTSKANMSKQFQELASATLAEIREWKGAIAAVISSGVPVVGTWPTDYHDRVSGDLLQATLAASTVADNQAVQLLQREYELLTNWSTTVVSERKALNAERSVDPNALQNDQSLAKISKCGDFLNSMIVGGNFYDDASCR